ATGRAAALLLEERQVGVASRARRARRAGLLGAQRLPQRRRPLARGALLRLVAPGSSGSEARREPERVLRPRRRVAGAAAARARRRGVSPNESSARAVEWLEQQLRELAGIRNATARDPSFKNWRQATLTAMQRIWPA